jgi:ribosome-associated heat shock protein Hsp15
VEKVRVDKYLWAIRVYKTRSLAAEACDKGKVVCNSNAVKPSYSVKPGDKFTIRIQPDYSKVIEVVALVDKRGSAEKMKPFYTDHSLPYVPPKAEPSAFYSPKSDREKGSGRPTKKERRDLDDSGFH